MVAGALRQCLERPSAKIECFHQVDFLDNAAASSILEGLTRSASVKEVVFEDVGLEGEDEARQLAKFIRKKANLESLRLCGCNFFDHQLFTDSLVELLVRRGSPLRYLSVQVLAGHAGVFPLATFRALLTGVSGSAQLEHLCIERNSLANYFDAYLQALLQDIQFWNVNKITLTFMGRGTERDEERLLGALRSNRTVQTVQCSVEDGGNWFSDANQARLEIHLDRNVKLKQWTKNPDSVPRELWQYALKMRWKLELIHCIKALLRSLENALASSEGRASGSALIAKFECSINV